MLKIVFKLKSALKRCNREYIIELISNGTFISLEIIISLVCSDCLEPMFKI